MYSLQHAAVSMLLPFCMSAAKQACTCRQAAGQSLLRLDSSVPCRQGMADPTGIIHASLSSTPCLWPDLPGSGAASAPRGSAV